MMAPSDASTASEKEVSRLVDRARSGNTEAFRRLVESHQDRVFGLVLRMVGNREEAEEVAQEVFLRAWRALPRFRGDARFSTWLYRIAYRQGCDAAASSGRRRQREESLDAVAAVAAESAAKSEAGASSLGRHVAALPEAQRATIALFYYGDRTVAEVARALELPEGTVKTHLHRARAALRRAIARERSRETRHGLR
jgi:RNA polymerase sigma-70 factor (ECF subfamily)